MSSYDEWIGKLTAELNETDLTEMMTTSEEELKYLDFDLEELAKKLSKINLMDLGHLLVLFHTRGSNTDKILKTMKKEAERKYRPLINKYHVKSKIGAEKSSITLARISLAAPIHSIQLAMKVDRLGIFSTVSKTSAFFGVNSMPYLLSYRDLNKNTRTMIWEAYIILNVGMHYIIHKDAKSIEKTIEIIQKVKAFALLTATGAKESMNFESVFGMIKKKTFDDKNALMKRYMINQGDLNDMPEPIFGDE